MSDPVIWQINRLFRFTYVTQLAIKYCEPKATKNSEFLPKFHYVFITAMQMHNYIYQHKRYNHTE